MSNQLEESLHSKSASSTPSPKSGTNSAPETVNPFQGPGAEASWQRLLAEPGRRVSREEALREMVARARNKK